MANVKCKKRKVSKKTKKSWRKHVDVKDVDEFLDNVRLEERLGQPLSQKSDSELFSIDVNDENENCTSKLDRRAALLSKEVRCFNLLKPHTLVSDPISKRNKVKILSQGRKLSKLKEKAALQKDTVTKLKTGSGNEDKCTFDVWEHTSSIPNIDTEWMTSDTVRHTLKHCGIQKRKVPQSLFKRTSALSPIEIPHSGISYNPSYEDHQNLLRDIAQKELELIKEEAHLNRVTTKMFQKVSVEEKDKNTMNELSEGLTLNGEDDNKDDIDLVDNNTTQKNICQKLVKKTLKQRRKQKEQKELAARRLLQKIERKKIADIYRLRKLQKQFDTREKKQLLSKEKKIHKQKEKSKMPKTLSKLKFEPAEPDFKMANELTGNLRNTEPEGNLLKDRYKSLQQRNIIQPSTRVKSHAKAKVKKFQKHDHKINYEN